MYRRVSKSKIIQRVGSRAQVMHGNAKMTGGGLKKKDLKYNKQGKIVSKKMSSMAKKEKRLQKAGWVTKKGQFGAIRSMNGGTRFKNMRGGFNQKQITKKDKTSYNFIEQKWIKPAKPTYVLADKNKKPIEIEYGNVIFSSPIPSSFQVRSMFQFQLGKKDTLYTYNDTSTTNSLKRKRINNESIDYLGTNIENSVWYSSISHDGKFNAYPEDGTFNTLPNKEFQSDHRLVYSTLLFGSNGNTLKCGQWNVAGINNSPFEYWPDIGSANNGRGSANNGRGSANNSSKKLNELFIKADTEFIRNKFKTTFLVEKQGHSGVQFNSYGVMINYNKDIYYMFNVKDWGMIVKMLKEELAPVGADTDLIDTYLTFLQNQPLSAYFDDNTNLNKIIAGARLASKPDQLFTTDNSNRVTVKDEKGFNRALKLSKNGNNPSISDIADTWLDGYKDDTILNEAMDEWKYSSYQAQVEGMVSGQISKPSNRTIIKVLNLLKDSFTDKTKRKTYNFLGFITLFITDMILFYMAIKTCDSMRMTLAELKELAKVKFEDKLNSLKKYIKKFFNDGGNILFLNEVTYDIYTGINKAIKQKKINAKFITNNTYYDHSKSRNDQASYIMVKLDDPTSDLNILIRNSGYLASNSGFSLSDVKYDVKDYTNYSKDIQILGQISSFGKNESGERRNTSTGIFTFNFEKNKIYLSIDETSSKYEVNEIHDYEPERNSSFYSTKTRYRVNIKAIKIERTNNNTNQQNRNRVVGRNIVFIQIALNSPKDKQRLLSLKSERYINDNPYELFYGTIIYKGQNILLFSYHGDTFGKNTGKVIKLCNNISEKERKPYIIGLDANAYIYDQGTEYT